MIRNILTLAVASALSSGVYAASDLTSQVNALQIQVNKLQKQVNSASTSASGVSVATYSPLSFQLLDNTVGTGTELSILKAREAGNLANSTLYFGGEAKADAIYQHTNTDGTYTDNVAADGGSSSALHLTQGALDVIGALNNWAIGYAQLGANEIGYDGSNDNISFQKAYLLLGNLNQSPVYGLVGKKEVDFGSLATVNMYTNPLTRLDYQAVANQAAVGYDQYGFNAVATVTNGGWQDGYSLYTPNSNQINNFALNANYVASNNGVNWNVGAGYVNGSGYQSTDGRNPAFDVNASVMVNNFTILAEYVANFDDQPDISGPASKPVSYDLGASYALPVLGYDSVISVDYSHAHAQDSSYAVHNYSQYVAGFRSEVSSNIWAGIEYVYNDGVYGTNNGDSWPEIAGVKNNTVLLDLTAMF